MSELRSSQEWSEILTAYESRNVTQRQFCADYEISLGSLYYHRRKQKQKPGCDKPKIIELAQPTQCQGGSLLQPGCQLEYLDPVLGQLKISCGANQLGKIVEGLSSARGYDLA